MHPTFSIIFFTTASGAGYGLLALFGLGLMFKLVPPNPAFTLSCFILALSAISFGLLSSTFHLGHPERAWRALTQWRSSWLSREGVLALLTYLPAFVLILNWQSAHESSGLFVALGLCVALLSLLTVYSTSMIYASLKSIAAWCNHWVPIVYLSLAIMSGALFMNALLITFDEPKQLLNILCILSIVVAAACKLAYWHFIKNNRSGTIESATGLGRLGKVSLLQAPHTERNYLQNEMGFKIARKHAEKLRRLSFSCCFILPFLLSLVLLFDHALLAIISTYLSVLFLVPGLIVERWLFFAEAEHTVSLYYGQTSVEKPHSQYNP